MIQRLVDIFGYILDEIIKAKNNKINNLIKVKFPVLNKANIILI